MKRIAVLYSENTPVLDALISKLENYHYQLMTVFPDNPDEFDLIVDVNFKDEAKSNVLKCHYSLLPAFPSDEPLREAFLAGVKVTGITIYYTKSQRILAQYPVFIKNEAHYDEILQEMMYLEQVILPIVVEKILTNEPVDIQSLLKGSHCSGGCSGCRH